MKIHCKPEYYTGMDKYERVFLVVLPQGKRYVVVVADVVSVSCVAVVAGVEGGKRC